MGAIANGGSLGVFAATKIEQRLSNLCRKLDASELLIAVFVYKLRFVLFARLIAERLFV